MTLFEIELAMLRALQLSHDNDCTPFAGGNRS